MSTLYNRFKARKESAENLLEKYKRESDDGYLDMACFDTQQSMEFLMKFICDERCIDYPKTHSITVLVDLIGEVIRDKSLLDRIYVLSDTITKWETQGRYGSGVKTSIRQVEEVLSLMGQLELEWLGQQE